MNMQPQDPDSRKAEAAWEVIDSVDTMQTARFTHDSCGSVEANPVARAIYGGPRPNESRVLITNVLLMAVHSSVSAWFDRGYEASEAADDGNAGAWYVGRIAWHTLSIGASAAAVINNQGLRSCKK